MDDTIQRAAGFFQLYEAALMKETTVDDVSGQNINLQDKGKKKERRPNLVKQVQQSAAAEFTWISELPSLKWTWGTDLTADDVQKLHISDHPPLPRCPHSGYNFSLPWGCQDQESLPPLSPSQTSCTFSAINKKFQSCHRTTSLFILATLLYVTSIMTRLPISILCSQTSHHCIS